MAKRVVDRLTDKECQKAKNTELHDGQGLWLIARGNGKSWLVRYQVRGSEARRKIGLGPYPVVSLRAARERKLEIRRQCHDGIDPKIARTKKQARKTLSKTLDDFMATYVGDDAGRWERRLRNHMAPLMDRLVPDVSYDDLSARFQEVVATSPSTAKKVISQTNMLFDFAFGKGMIEVNPVDRAKLAVKTALANHKSEHHPMVAPADAADLYLRLSEAEDDICLLALRFLFLCPARSGNVRLAEWKDMDLEAGLWTVDASETKTGQKTGRDFQTPLSQEAVRVLRAVHRLTQVQQGLVFPGLRKGQPMVDATMSKRLKSFDFRDPKTKRPVVPHGFRATFKTWAQDHTDFDQGLVERALDHAVKGDVQKAYDRARMIERRRVVMEAWASFLTRDEALDAAGNVVAIR